MSEKIANKIPNLFFHKGKCVNISCLKRKWSRFPTGLKRHNRVRSDHGAKLGRQANAQWSQNIFEIELQFAYNSMNLDFDFNASAVFQHIYLI